MTETDSYSQDTSIQMNGNCVIFLFSLSHTHTHSRFLTLSPIPLPSPLHQEHIQMHTPMKNTNTLVLPLPRFAPSDAGIDRPSPPPPTLCCRLRLDSIPLPPHGCKAQQHPLRPCLCLPLPHPLRQHCAAERGDQEDRREMLLPRGACTHPVMRQK